MADLAAGDLPCDLAGACVEGGGELVDVGRVLAEDDLADNIVHVLVLELHLHCEAIGQLLQDRGSEQLRLARGDDQDSRVETRAAALNEVLNGEGLGTVLVDVLLNLVEHDQREGDDPRGARDVLQHRTDVVE